MLYVFLWFLRAIEYSFFLLYSFYKYKKALQKDWGAKLKTLPAGDLSPKEVILLVIIPTYKEPLIVLHESIGSIALSNFPKKQIYFCLATEERDQKNAQKNSKILKKEFSDAFEMFYSIEHPKNLPNEIAGKGANISYAAKKIAADFTKKGIDFRRVLITTLDADNKIHPDLLNVLTFEYCKDSSRHKRSFQPLPLFFNNIWQVPTLNRIVALSSSFWHLIESGRPDRLRNFSSHSQPLSALAEMDYWDKTTIVEDGRQYWRSFLHFNGDYEVTPVFLPIYQDAILSNTFFRSLNGQFHQLRRWAWGCSDIAYFANGIWKNWRKLPHGKSLLQFIRLVEGHYMWATAALFLFLSAISGKYLNPEFGETLFGMHFSILLSVLFKVALVGIIISMVMTHILIPPPPNHSQRFALFWQWILLPISTICFGSLPAIFTQTQLAIGKKMKFNVTEKVRKKEKK